MRIKQSVILPSKSETSPLPSFFCNQSITANHIRNMLYWEIAVKEGFIIDSAADQEIVVLTRNFDMRRLQKA